MRVSVKSNVISVKKCSMFLVMLLCLFLQHLCFSATAKKGEQVEKKHIRHAKHVSSKSTKRQRKVTNTSHVKLAKKSHAMPHTSIPHHPPHNAKIKTKMHTTHTTTTDKKLTDYVRQTVTTLKRSTYKLGGNYIDTERGIFIVDCSTYVNHIIKSVFPHSYSNLTSTCRSQKPTTHDYYRYFTNLSINQSPFWTYIYQVNELQAGDILVFRYKNIRGRETGGHVMIVMDKPLRNGNTFFVKVADSATVGHTQDTRLLHHSGIGIGTLLLKTNGDSLHPSGYAWKIGSRWENNVNFAMARPNSHSG